MAARSDALVGGASTLRRIVRGTATYTAAAILLRAVNFLLLPLFTGVLSPTEFGQIGVLTTIAAAMSVLASFGLETAVFRGYGRALRESGDPERFVNTLGVFALVAPLFGALLFSVALAPALAGAFEVPVEALRLAGVGAALLAIATILPMAILRAQERLRAYLQLTGLQVAVTPTLTVLLVVFLAQGATGWMLAYALSAAILLVRGLVILGHRWSLTVDRRILAAALAFGIPLIPHALAHWGLSVSDRAILAANVPTSDVGEYYLAYLACLPVALISIALSQATQPLFVEAGLPEGRNTRVGRATAAQAVLIVGTAIAVGTLGPAVTLLVLPADYAGAVQFIPWLAAGTCLFGLYLMPMNAISITAGKTRRVWVITMIAAAVNVALNLALVPERGAMAAAVNTTIGYGILLIGIFLYMRRVCNPPMPFDGRRIAVGVLVIGIPAILAAIVTNPSTLTGLIIRLVVLGGSVGVLMAGPFRRETAAVVRSLRPSRVTR